MVGSCSLERIHGWEEGIGGGSVQAEGRSGARASTTPTPGRTLDLRVKTSTLVLAFGALLFVLPVPGTFVGGTLVLLVGAFVRWLGT
jgi:hypothetical protein